MSINRSGSKNLIKIYIASSLDQLKPHVNNIWIDPKNVEVRTAVSILSKLYREANMHVDKGDEERAYISFMRYLKFIQLVQQTKEEEEQVFFNNSVGAKNVTFAKKNVETLSISLEERYKQLRKEQELEDQVEQSNILDALKPQSKAAIGQEKVLGIPLINGVPANLGVPQEHPEKDNEITVSPGKPKVEQIENLRSKGLLANLPEFDRSKKPAAGLKDVPLENQNFLEDRKSSLNSYKQLRKEQELADQVEQSNILDALKPQSKAAIEQEKVLGIPLINGVPANLGVPQEHLTLEEATALLTDCETSDMEMDNASEIDPCQDVRFDVADTEE